MKHDHHRVLRAVDEIVARVDFVYDALEVVHDIYERFDEIQGYGGLHLP